ncbi:MAG TPA: hypothetical protein VE860_19795 [Chthoniobacterales bacterium]|nr:hypothetical protein [Chthoniobacterales bacterium]
MSRLFIFGSLFVLVIIFGGWFGLRFFIQSDAFREWLGRRVGRSLHAEVKFEPLTWEGWTFRSASFSAIGTGKRKLRSLHMRNLTAHIDWKQLLKGQLLVDLITADEADAAFGKNRAPIPKPGPHPKEFAIKLPKFFHTEVKVEQVRVTSADIHWTTNRGENGQYTGFKLIVTRTGPDQWDAITEGGAAQHATYPELQVEHVHALVSRDSITIAESRAAIYGGGNIEVTGKIATRKMLNAQLTADFSGIDANPLLPTDWRLGGRASGQLVYAGDLDRFEHGSVTGIVKIDDATLDLTNLFPTLRKLARFSGLKDVQIDSIQAHVQYKEQQLDMSDIRATSQDQIRVEGSCLITPDKLDGELLLGLSPKILGWIPGAEKVFVDQRAGLRWAKVSISGSPERPKEDLTQRLFAAFRDKMMKEFDGGTKDAVKSLLDLLRQ